jgi:succinoglycan biosynthesis transport protein ExoP
MWGRRTASAAPVAAPVEGEANLGTVARALWRRKQAIIGPTLIIAAAAFIAVNLLTPKYKSEARVLYEGRENIFLRPEADKLMIDRNVVDQEALTSQVQLVLSRDLAREVIAQLKLSELPEFNPALSEFSPMTVLRLIGLARDPLSLSVEERVLATYYDRLSAYAVDKSRVIVIEFQSFDPDLAARAANAIAEKYLSLQQVAKQDQARSAGQWLSGEIEKLRNKVSEAEAKVEAFRAKSNLFVGTNNTSLSNQQLTELSTQLSGARAQKADAETRARLIREQLRSGQPIESSDVVNSELIRRLSEQRVTLRAQLAEQSSTLLPQHPRIKELRAQIADLDQQIRGEGERLVRSLENDAKVAASRLDSLSANLDQLKRAAASTSDQDVQLRAFEREAKAQRDLFESYLAKYREATARDSIAAAPADARVISRAVVSNLPYFPKKVPIVLIATLATFCLCCAFVVTGTLLAAEPSYRLGRRMEDIPHDLDRRQVMPRAPDARTRSADHEPAVPVIPTVAPAPVAATPVAAVPAAPVRVPVDDIAAALREAGEAGRRVAVIGSAREVGTSLTAIALARSLARSARVVLVDLAFNAPNLDVISENPSAPGIAELVRGAASFSHVITRDRFSRAHLVAAGRVQADTGALLNSYMLASALDALANSYDHVVIDAGAQSDIALAPMVRIAPRAVLVAGPAQESAVNALRDQLRSAGFADVAVLTGPPPALDHAVTRSAAA